MNKWIVKYLDLTFGLILLAIWITPLIKALIDEGVARFLLITLFMLIPVYSGYIIHKGVLRIKKINTLGYESLSEGKDVKNLSERILSRQVANFLNKEV